MVRWWTSVGQWRGLRFQSAFRFVVYPLPGCRILNSPLEIWS
jgi:hypothetical protein